MFYLTVKGVSLFDKLLLINIFFLFLILFLIRDKLILNSGKLIYMFFYFLNL